MAKCNQLTHLPFKGLTEVGPHGNACFVVTLVYPVFCSCVNAFKGQSTKRTETQTDRQTDMRPNASPQQDSRRVRQ